MRCAKPRLPVRKLAPIGLRNAHKLGAATFAAAVPAAAKLMGCLPGAAVAEKTTKDT